MHTNQTCHKGQLTSKARRDRSFVSHHCMNTLHDATIHKRFKCISTTPVSTPRVTTHVKTKHNCADVLAGFCTEEPFRPSRLGLASHRFWAKERCQSQHK